MKFVIQRVNHAKVTADGEVTGEIGKGFYVLVGVCAEDDTAAADRLIRKMAGLRIFADSQDKTNLALKDVGGEVLMVSQFTLYADCRKGYRPSFSRAGSAEHARELYEYVLAETAKLVLSVQQGKFGAHMDIELEADGPFTIILDSGELG